MIKTSIKKMFLIFFGLLLALLFIETSMQLSGFALSNWQKYRNNKILNNKSQYTVMCIGESTTAGQYPRQLQQILNAGYPGMFTIIDCGVVCIPLQDIDNSIETHINRYNPDIAVCMMGGVDIIDSNGILIPNISFENINKLKICENIKICKFLKEYFKLKTINKKISFTNSLYGQFQQAFQLFHGKEYIKSAELFKKILKADPSNETAHAYLVNAYYNSNNKNTAYQMALNALKTNSNYKELYYETAIDYNIHHKNISKVSEFISEIINEPDIIITSSLYTTIEKMLTHEQKEKLFKKTVSKYQVVENIMTFEEKEMFFKREISKNIDIIYGALAVYCMGQKDFNAAKRYFDIAEKLRIDFPNETISDLYRSIVKKLTNHNIKVICMQYPVRSIKPLQNILKDTSYYNKVTFVSNEVNFKKVLEKNKFDHPFRDQYAGDFGHCTDYGNTLIAENVAKTLAEVTGINE